jgi:iron(III) transport system permease protein
MLSSSDNITLPVVVWSLWRAGNFGQASALTLIIMLIGSPVALLYLRLAGGSRLVSRGQI